MADNAKSTLEQLNRHIDKFEDSILLNKIGLRGLRDQRLELAIQFICEQIDDLRDLRASLSSANTEGDPRTAVPKDDDLQRRIAALKACLLSDKGEAGVPKEIASRLGVSFLTEVRAIPYEDGEVKIVHGGDNFRMETWFTKDGLIGIIEQYEKDTER